MRVRALTPITLALVVSLGCADSSGDTDEAGDEIGVTDTEEGSSEDTTSSDSSDTVTDTDTSDTGTESTTGMESLCPADIEAAFPEAWIHGADCAFEPDIQVHWYDSDTVILRQSLCTNFEGPFMFMLFGEDEVLLEDTGAGGIAIAATVDAVIEEWLEAKGRASIERVVVNSHAHGDHVQGNGQFVGQPNTAVVGTSVSEVSSFFGIQNWRDDIASYDLGGRVIDVLPIPGHQNAHIALFDASRGWLLTGDTLYPGRLYIADFGTYVTSIQRMVDFVDGKEVCAVLGTHVEMTTTPGVDFEFGSTHHPNEHGLWLGLEHLVELRDAVVAMNGTPAYEVHDDFIIYPL
ncbi:beta-lactamase-like protein [Plesiocystis pacifica SIR-1]|uniref:Beta-lactamase-like protein n=1 Tax=Plesiocystis pacifica SIR-1 TaxID=391625 RepID=A6GE82_9BACT|nr:beta-lactamase-like protein [Plesiocystis pacifica SIR-1]